MADQAALRVAILGVGMMGGYHAATLSTRIKGAHVSVINDFSPQRAEEVAAATPGARIVDDPLEAIGADDVDAVVIATPGAAHEEQVLACLERGIPVLCEKPLTLTSSSAYGVVTRQAELGRELIQVGFMRRFDHEYAALREMIGSGELGNPLMVHCAHRNPAVPGTVTTEGVIKDSAVHEIDTARFLLGEEITAVSVLHGRSAAGTSDALDDPLLMVFETQSGVLVTDELFVSSGIAYEVRTEVVGDRGIAMIGLDQNLVSQQSTGRWGGQHTANFVQRFGNAYQEELQRWVAAASRGGIDGPGAWDGYAAAAVCEAGVKAFQTGQRVKVEMEARP